MKSIKSDTGFLMFQKIFKHLHSNQIEVVIWQNAPHGEKWVHHTLLLSFNPETRLLHFEQNADTEISEGMVFCYCEQEQFIFKSEVLSFKSQTISIAFPEEIKVLEEPEALVMESQFGVRLSTRWVGTGLKLNEMDGPNYLKVKSMAERSSRDQEFLNSEFDSVSLDEEEKMYADKRESPRARPKIDKWVKIKGEVDEEVHFLRLFDLSRGGIGFLTMDTHLFPKGSNIRVVGFEEFDLDDPLVGVVMSHRPIDDTQIEFKVGVKFNEGQE